MPLGGLLPYGANAAIPQQQAEPFQWGAGGRRMTPEQIAREREIATAMMGVDYSPVASPWQGLARVSENLTGALRARKANKAEQANMNYSDEILQSLMNPGGVPSASGAPGVASPTPGANQLSAILANPFVSQQVQALAKRQIDLADFETRQRIQSQHAEPTEIARLAREAYPNDPAAQAAAIKEGLRSKTDPLAIIPDLGGGIGGYVGPRSQLEATMNRQMGNDDAPDTLPPDFFEDGGAPSVASAPQAPTMLEPWQYESFVKSMGKEAADQFLRSQGLTVGGR